MLCDLLGTTDSLSIQCSHPSSISFSPPSIAMHESSYICDACGEEIVIPIDASGGSRQDYVEDCPVCCHPSLIHVDIDSDGEARVWAEAEQDRT